MTEPLPNDVVARIARDFSESDQSFVVETFSSWKLHRSSPANDQRIMRCVLFESQGDRRKFDQLIFMAKRDWRDVIVAAEYGVREGKLIRLRDLTDSFSSG